MEASGLYEWLKDAEEEGAWIREKLPLASSTNVGDSLPAVQSQWRKHQALEQVSFPFK